MFPAINLQFVARKKRVAGSFASPWSSGSTGAQWKGRQCTALRRDLHEKIWGFPKMGDTPIAGWFLVEDPIKIDDLGVPII